MCIQKKHKISLKGREREGNLDDRIIINIVKRCCYFKFAAFLLLEVKRSQIHYSAVAFKFKCKIHET